MGEHGDSGVPLVLLTLDAIMVLSVLSDNPCLALEHPRSTAHSLHPSASVTRFSLNL